MTLALFFLGWFALSLLVGAAWAATASTRRRGMDTRYPLVPDQPEPATDQPARANGVSMDTTDAMAW